MRRAVTSVSLRRTNCHCPSSAPLRGSLSQAVERKRGRSVRMRVRKAMRRRGDISARGEKGKVGGLAAVAQPELYGGVVAEARAAIGGKSSGELPTATDGATEKP